VKPGDLVRLRGTALHGVVQGVVADGKRVVVDWPKVPLIKSGRVWMERDRLEVVKCPTCHGSKKAVEVAHPPEQLDKTSGGV